MIAEGPTRCHAAGEGVSQAVDAHLRLRRRGLLALRLADGSARLFPSFERRTGFVVTPGTAGFLLARCSGRSLGSGRLSLCTANRGNRLEGTRRVFSVSRQTDRGPNRAAVIQQEAATGTNTPIGGGFLSSSFPLLVYHLIRRRRLRWSPRCGWMSCRTEASSVPSTRMTEE